MASILDLMGKPKSELIKENLEEMFHSRRSTLLILPSVSRLVLNTAQRLNGCWIAGGAPLALYTGDVNTIRDWDLFFNSVDAWNAGLRSFEKLGFKQAHATDWSQTLEMAGVIVQLITRRFYLNIEHIFDTFDFTVCCFAIEGLDIYYTKEAKRDVESKKLNYIYTDEPATCIKRVARYGAKGFTPSDDFALKMAKMLQTTPLEKLKEVRGTS